MSNPVLYQALGILLILFFLFLIYMFTKTWRWFHVLCAFSVFAASIWFICCAAMSYRTHAAWRALELKSRQKSEELESEFGLLMNGDLTEIVQTTKSIRRSNAEFARLVFDRGRVWRSCTPQAPQANGTVVVGTVPADTVAGEEPTTSQMIKDMILYAFFEDVAPADAGVPPDTKLPAIYLGEFTATVVNPTSVTLQPTLPLSVNLPGLAQAGATWTLYETMPVDGHNFFAADMNEVPDLNEDADVSPVFGTVDPAFVDTYVKLPQRLQNQTDAEYQQVQAAHAAILEMYKRDGKRGDPDSDPRDNVWAKVKFTEEHSVDVDSGAVLGGVEGSQTFFNQGLAEIPLLQRGEPAKFKPDQIGVFPREDAERLIAAGVCEPGEDIYVRTLNDYEYQFRSNHLRMVRLRQDIERMQRNMQEITEANARTETQIAYRTQERDKLREDLTKFQFEQTAITKYQGELEQVFKVKMAELSRLYLSNAALEQELDRMSNELTDQINQRTREAVAEAG
jgi:hypothetical protein